MPRSRPAGCCGTRLIPGPAANPREVAGLAGPDGLGLFSKRLLYSAIPRSPRSGGALEPGITMSTGPRQQQFAPELAEYARLAADGRLTVRIDRTLPLAEAARALELSEAGHPRGKLVLLP